MTDRSELIAQAGERVFGRGEEYFVRGRVRAMAADDGKISALVDGNRSYRVSLRMEARPIGHQCECPEGAAGRFCKHCVAVCLAYSGVLQDAESSGAATAAGLRGCLSRMPDAELIELMLGEAMKNERFRERLFLRAARIRGRKPDLNAYSRFLQFAAHAAVSTDDAGRARTALKEVESSLGNLLEEGFAEEVAALTEEALPLLASLPVETLASQELTACLLSFHHKSYSQLPAEPEELAHRLFNWQMHSLFPPEMSVCKGMAPAYCDLLGGRGLTLYQQLIEAEWNRLRSVGETASPEDRAKFARLTEMMEDAARRRGDIKSLITIKSHRLNGPIGYLEIARLCKQGGEWELALRWALGGKNLFPVSEAEDLYRFLAAEYEERNEWREALEVLLALFSAKPSLSDYRKMAECARRIGEWDVWRERALSALRQSASASPSRLRRDGKEAKPNQFALAVLVSILLWENDDEAAWQAARQGECDDELLLELANRRTEKHPEDALLIYRRLVTRNVNRKNNYAYRRAIELLHTIGRLMKKRKQRDEFVDYVERLRHQHLAQRNFAKLVDQMMARYYRRRAGSS
ncbi:MAG: SWIM zinc finger family protein [Blastocatellia bacterium]